MAIIAIFNWLEFNETFPTLFTGKQEVTLQDINCVSEIDIGEKERLAIKKSIANVSDSFV